jgi:hypothetical protein
MGASCNSLLLYDRHGLFQQPQVYLRGPNEAVTFSMLRGIPECFFVAELRTVHSFLLCAAMIPVLTAVEQAFL